MAVRGTSNQEIGFAGLLLILFIAFKLAKIIDWPWIWVLSPFWIPLCAAAAFVLFCLVMAGISKLKERS